MSTDPLDFTLAVSPASGSAVLPVVATLGGGGVSMRYAGGTVETLVKDLFPGPGNTNLQQVTAMYDIGPGDNTTDLHFSLSWSQFEPRRGVPHLYLPDGTSPIEVPHDITINVPVDNELDQQVVDYTVPAGHYQAGRRLVLTTNYTVFDPLKWLVLPPPWEGNLINRDASYWWQWVPTGSSTSVFEFDWDDGSPIQRTQQRVLRHTYIAPGVYTVTCTLYRAEDNTKGQTHAATVAVGVPSDDPLSAPFPGSNAAGGYVRDARTAFKPVMPR